MTATWSFGLILSLLTVHARAVHTWEDSHGGHGNTGRQRRVAGDQKDKSHTVAVDHGAQFRVAGTHGHKSRLSIASPPGTELGSSEDEAVLREMGLSEDSHKAEKPAPPLPAFVRREALYSDSDIHMDGGEGSGDHTSHGEHHDDYELPDVLLQNDLESDARSSFWDRRRRRRRVDCSYTTWSGWSDCTLTCAGGVKQQKRSTSGPYHGGKACFWDYTLKEEACNSDPCPVPCTFTPWGGWGGCSKTCATGQKTRTRQKDGPFHGGPACVGTLTSTADCNTQNCPQDCYFQAWSAFGACSKTCIDEGNFGYKTRDRGKVGPYYGGKACVGHATDDGLCNTFTCPSDCVANEWGPWSVCSQTCSTSIVHHGYHMRSRTSTAASNGGRVCSNNVQMVHCNTQLCPVDCYWLEWGAWGPCSKTCTEKNTASGIRIRVREKIGPMGAGKDCDAYSGAITSTTSCNDFSCPVDCTFKQWQEWGGCSKSCDTGVRTRQRGKNEAMYGGKECVGKTQHSEMCESWQCPVDCRWTTWDAWMPCSKSCGGGNTHRSRAYDPKPISGGKACVGAHMEMIDCKGEECPIDCAWEEWLDWSLCSSSCGDGKRTRIRLVRIAATYGGQECDHETGAVLENECPEMQPCPLDCRFSEWAEWDVCNASCEQDGHRNSNRSLLQAENGGADICPEGPMNKALECTGKLCSVELKAGAPRVLAAASALLWVVPFFLWSD